MRAARRYTTHTLWRQNSGTDGTNQSRMRFWRLRWATSMQDHRVEKRAFRFGFWELLGLLEMFSCSLYFRLCKQMFCNSWDCYKCSLRTVTYIKTNQKQRPEAHSVSTLCKASATTPRHMIPSAEATTLAHATLRRAMSV